MDVDRISVAGAKSEYSTPIQKPKEQQRRLFPWQRRTVFPWVSSISVAKSTWRMDGISCLRRMEMIALSASFLSFRSGQFSSKINPLPPPYTRHRHLSEDEPDTVQILKLNDHERQGIPRNRPPVKTKVAGFGDGCIQHPPKSIGGFIHLDSRPTLAPT
jgi:hypothetical protein